MHATAVHQANTAFAVGGTIVLLERGRTDGDTICATIERERPSVLEIVGDVLMRRIARALDDADARGEPYDLSSLQRIHNSGAMVSAPLKDALLSRGTMHVYDSLGSSEAVGFGVALTTAAGEGETARFRIGPNARLLVAADRDELVEPGSGAVGVLAVHTSCATGYYKDPARTAATFRMIDGRLHAIPGDQATLDVDGTLTLLGRGSNCINSGGEKIWPEEVEEVLKEHPAVSDAVVLGVPDDEWGELVAAVVSTTGDDPPDAEALGDWVSARLAGYKRPRRFVFADEVGRNTVGKLDYEWARRAVMRSAHRDDRRGADERCSRTRAAALAVSSCTKKWVPCTVTSGTPARSAWAANMPSGRSVPSAQTTVTPACSDARWSNDAGAPSGLVPHSKNHASTSGGHASSTWPSGRSRNPHST